MSTKHLCSITSLAALMFGFQPQATAGVVISGDYYEQSDVARSCPASTECRIDFEPIPSGMKLDVHTINCVVTTSGILSNIRLSSSKTLAGLSSRMLVFPIERVLQPNNVYSYTVNTETTYRVAASPYLHIDIVGAGSFSGSAACAILGKLTPK